jgi:hypothetical protein
MWPVPKGSGNDFSTQGTMKGKALPEHGFYVDLRKTGRGDLEILLNETGQKSFEEIQGIRDRYGIHAALDALLEDHLQTGWEIVPPEDICALTSAPILSDEIERDEEGRVTKAGRVYWYPDYAVRDEIQEIHEKLMLVFQGVERP